jgi:hypothetical protein
METKSRANILKTQQEKLNELHAQQEKLKVLQDELDVLESKIKNNEKLSVDDTKFIGELGWLRDRKSVV